MKRPTEAQLEFPLLSILFDPLAVNAVQIELQMDWGMTGEIVITYSTLQSLEDLLVVWDFARNAVADELLSSSKEVARKARKEKGAKADSSAPF